MEEFGAFCSRLHAVLWFLLLFLVSSSETRRGSEDSPAAAGPADPGAAAGCEEGLHGAAGERQQAQFRCVEGGANAAVVSVTARSTPPPLSPGFYELSDGGSCSRSNSCTSVYSECLSSSQTSLVAASPSGQYVSPPPQVDVCRRLSADESRPTLVRTAGLHLGSSRIRAKAAEMEHARPRPVSTGS